MTAPTHRNRTLVVNNATSAPTPGDTAVAPVRAVTPTVPAGVTTRDRGLMQWTSNAVYDQKAQEKQKAIEETALVKQQQRDTKQKNRILNHVYGKQSSAEVVPSSIAPREIIINELRFRLTTDGSKLIRVYGQSMDPNGARAFKYSSSTEGAKATAQSTPKQAKVASVTFYRTKNGNLLRSGVVKQQRYHRSGFHKEEYRLTTVTTRKTSSKKSDRLCPSFTSTGTQIPQHPRAHPMDDLGLLRPLFIGRPTPAEANAIPGQCPQGNRCHYTHDINKLAICQDFLRHGSCDAGEEACNLSHDPTPNRVPACIHFLRGKCTKEDCRYAHVNVNASAPVCRDFATLGYCSKGVSCTERHVSECPDYSNTGTCRNKKCRLPHVDRAGNLRKAAVMKANKGSDDNESSDLSSDEEDYQEIDSDDVDSEAEQDIVMTGVDRGHELDQQQDFISFS